MRVTHVVPSLEDRHGGPSRSVRALANAMAATGSAELLTTAVVGEPVPPLAGDRASLRSFIRETPLWLARSSGLRDALSSTSADVVHNHGLWLLPLRYAKDATARREIPLVISPRGMLSGWAYQHRRWRKRVAEMLIHPGAFAAASGWHATSSAEADDIRRLGFPQPICVAPNGVPLPGAGERAAARDHWLEAAPVLRERRVAVFYSRLHRKKRVRELIDLWLAEPRGDWILLIAGVEEEYSAAEIGNWIATANARDRVVVLDGTGRPHPYAVGEIFLLPSHPENFGMVIAEALAAEIPALVTDTTPWENLAHHDAGWCVPWHDYRATLRDALATPAERLRARGANGRSWMAREFSWERAAAMLWDFYRTLPADGNVEV